jgi:long-chain fatty acid transport protein
MRLTHRFVLGGLTILASTVAVSTAHASGFAVRENCTEGLGMAFGGAGSLADTPCTVFNNPAGMTELQGTQFEGGITPVFPTIDFHGGLTNAAGAPLPGNNGGNGGRVTAIPNLYGVTDLGQDLKGGIAVTTPFGLPVKYPSNWDGRYLAIEASAISVDINPNLAYRINDKLSVGGGVSAQYIALTFSTAVNQAPLGTPYDAIQRFKGHNWGVGYNFGVLYKPIEGTKVGLTYRSKIDHKLAGDQDFANVGPALAGPAGLVSGPARVSIDLPATTGLSVSHDVTSKLTLGWDLQWTQWSTFQGIGINAAVPSEYTESYRDTFFTALGASYRLTEAWTLRGGVGWDQSPVKDGFRDVAVPDGDRYMAGAGFGYALNPRTDVSFSYAHYFATHASMNDSINNTAPGAVPPLTTTVLGGSYQLSLDYVSASIRVKF